MGIRFSIRTRGAIIPRHLEQFIRRVEDLTPAMQAATGAMLDQVEREFATETWESPTGPRPWAARRGIGSRAPSEPPLGDALGAWRRGRRIATNRTATLSPSGPGAEYIPYHRGGGRSKINLAPHRWKATTPARTARAYKPSDPQYWAMWWKVFLDFGAALTIDQLRGSGLEVPKRPHGTRSPALTRRLRQIVLNYAQGLGARA